MNSQFKIALGTTIGMMLFSPVAFGYGAIAYSKSTGAYGYSYNKESKRAAIRSALRRCNRRDCKSVLSVSNRCGALVRRQRDTRYIGTGRASSKKAAYTEAKESCGSHCKKIVAICDEGE